MSDFRTYITQTGFGLEREAKLNNTHVPFANLVVGSGKLNDADSPANQTGLINKVKSYPVTIEKDDIDPSVWVARAEIPASEGGFSIFEAGVETSDGYLYCYARQPGDYKPLLSEGQGKSYTIRLKFIPSNADTIEIKIDPSVQFATPSDLNNSASDLIAYTDKKLAELKALYSYQVASGSANAIELTDSSSDALNAGDVFRFLVLDTNTSANITVKVNQNDAFEVANVTSVNQVIKGALVSIRFTGSSFFVLEQVNPNTGNDVIDIGKLITDTTDVISIGEVILNGATLSRTTHSIAWEKIKSTSNIIDQATKDADLTVYGGYWGDGDGSTTFTLPVVGGEFIRMFDDGRGVDDGRIFASHQTDAIRNIEGVINSNYAVFNEGLSGAFTDVELDTDYSITTSGDAYTKNGKVKFDASSVVPTSSENRPRSIAYYGKTRL